MGNWLSDRVLDDGDIMSRCKQVWQAHRRTDCNKLQASALGKAQGSSAHPGAYLRIGATVLQLGLDVARAKLVLAEVEHAVIDVLHTQSMKVRQAGVA